MNTLMTIMDSAPTFFASGYAEARVMFREACTACGARVVEYAHPLKGPDGGLLAIDVALLGSASASKLLIVISGTHGVEGLAGSGCQVAWLRLRKEMDLPADTAVLLVHMLNPWGCAWHRRQTEDNVDLNRNFHKFDASLPINPLYEAVHSIVVNQTHVTRASADPLLLAFRQQRGDQALAAALFSGQYEHSDGVGFGGHKPSWSNITLHNIVNTYAMSAKCTVVLDIHTGLGPFGYGTLISAEPRGSAALERARSKFGLGVVSVSEDATVPYEISGNILSWMSGILHSEVTGVALEFGTFELAKLLELQVDDCRLRKFRDSWSSLGGGIRSDLVEFFFPATADWMQSAVLRALQIIHLAINGLQERSANAT
jgi:octopine/nopaline transport system ATP-binding protein